MSKTGFNSTNSKSQYYKKTENYSNFQPSSRKQTQFKDFDEDSDFFDDFNPEPQGNIIHQSTEKSFDEQGNLITKRKIVREIEEKSSKNENKNRKMSKKIKEENKKVSNLSRVHNEIERQKELYSSPDLQSNSPYESSPNYTNDRKNSKNIEEIGYKTNYTYESKKINGKNVGSYMTKEKYEYINRNGRKESRYEKSSQGSPGVTITENISPVAYIDNNSSGSDYEECQMKSFDNYKNSVKINRTNKFTNINENSYNMCNRIENNNYKLNYELEDPEGFDYLTRNEKNLSKDSHELKKSHYFNRSHIKNRIDDSYRSDKVDFQSPERNINEVKRFRNVNMRMIDSKGPTNDDGKVTNIMTKKITETKKSYQNYNYYYSENPKIRNNAAKIIQAWWRKKYNREEEVYNITVKSAVKLQSFIRGFLVRKKVLRYITLAIYYQSFCDKIQDILCSNVKRRLFKYFKEKYLYNFTKKKNIQKFTKESMYKRRKILINIIKKYTEKKNFYALQLLRRWKEYSYKLKLKERTQKATRITKSNTNSNFYTNINEYKGKKTNIDKFSNTSLKQTKVKTIRTNINNKYNYFNNRNSHNTIQYKSKTLNYNPNLCKMDTHTSFTKIKTNKVNCTYNYPKSNSQEKEKHYSPIIYHNNRNYNYEIKESNKSKNELNKSYDNALYNKYNRKEYTSLNERKNYKCFQRVEKSKEKNRDKSISPEFGKLRQANNRNKNINYNINNDIKNKSICVINKRTKLSNFNDMNNHKIDKNLNTNIDRNIKKTKIIIKRNIDKNTQGIGKIIKANSNFNRNKCRITNSNIKRDRNAININKTMNIKRTKNTLTKFSTQNNLNKSTNLYDKRNKNEIISGGTLSIIKLPNKNLRRNKSFSKTENKYKKEIIIRSDEKYRNRNKNDGYNEIDNQLAISIVKLPEEENKRLNRTMIKEDYKEIYEEQEPKIIERIKQKIIKQKQRPPETAEEGNDMQVFDMKIIKGISMNIKPSVESRKIIKDENKEIEIFKKREREKNKEIDKYKKDIEKHKQKSKLDSLKRAIRIVETFKKMILQKKFTQFKNNCFNRHGILEMDDLVAIEFLKIPKKTRDFSAQINTKIEKKDIKIKKKLKKESPKKFKILKISKDHSVSIESKNKKIKKSESSNHKITKSKLNIISNIKKKDMGQQMEPWHTEIDYLENTVAYEHSKPKTIESGSQYTNSRNIKGKTEQIQILRNKPLMIDDSIQHECEENYIEQEYMEIIGSKPLTRENNSQYENIKLKTSKQDNFNIIIKKKKEIEKKIETCEKAINTSIKTKDIGINSVEEIKPKPKNIEVKIRTVKRSLTKLEIPLLKKLWLRKAFRTFKDNCNRPPFHKILEREFLRMALLKWRFRKGYGPDRYGNAYDRDGNFLYKIKGKVADFEVQNSFRVEQAEESTQYIPIKNLISIMEKFEIPPSYKKPKKKMTKDVCVGNNNELDERIEEVDRISILTKIKKKENKIDRNNNFRILRNSKRLKDAQTQIFTHNRIIIEKMDDFDVIDNESSSIKKKLSGRLKELLIQIIYRKTIEDKLSLSESLRKWIKHTLIDMHMEETELENLRRRQTKIKKNDRFSLIENIEKEDVGTQMAMKTYKNKIDRILDINFINKIKKKNAEINVDIPYQFDLDNIKPYKGNKIIYKSNKKPLVLKKVNENDMNIYSHDYIFREEIKRGIHHPMTEESKERVMEILYNFLNTRGNPISLLNKCFSIWYRKANYLTLLKNARIISIFCKSNLNRTLNNKKWKKLSEKLLLREKIKIIKDSKKKYHYRKKIFDLIRLTRLNTVYSKRRYLHLIIIAWLVYTRNINQKRSHVKALYENMLTTYMNMADDVFGSNQKENPSVQDALYEAVDSNKFQTKNLQDVPLAKEYYQNKKEFIKISNNIYFTGNENKDLDNKEFYNYKNFISKYPKTYSSSETNKYENIKIIQKSKEGFNKEKIIKIKDEERLSSRGRGRAYRTKIENEILNKYNSINYNNKMYENIKRKEVENNEDNEDNEEIEEDEDVEKNENNNINSRTFNKLQDNTRNIIPSSSNRDLKNNNVIINSINTKESNNYYDEEENSDDKRGKKKMLYGERRKLFRQKFQKEQSEDE